MGPLWYTQSVNGRKASIWYTTNPIKNEQNNYIHILWRQLTNNQQIGKTFSFSKRQENAIKTTMKYFIYVRMASSKGQEDKC